ncbi:MAG: DUF4340 domain-containing protein [Vulcanimicrobiota bacterium]
MNRTQLFLLLAALSLGCFYVWSKANKLQTTHREYEEARYFPSLTEEEVSRIRVVCTDPVFEYELVSHGDEWFIDSHLLKIEKSHQLVTSVLELSREREMEPDPDAEREKEFGLDEPSYRITVWKDGKEVATVKLGDRVPDYNHFYGQLESGGSIWTVPAYALGVLEEEPKDLRETALLPVDVPAVKNLSVLLAGDKVLELKQNEDQTFSFVVPKSGKADESRVEAFLFKLKDLKVGRFLAPDEETLMGDTVVTYQARLGYSKYLRVTELKQRVGVQPQFVYGQRYLQDPETGEPVPNTLEKFVVEIGRSSELMNPDASTFEDRRVAIFDMDKVKGLELQDIGKSYSGVKNLMGKWETQKGKDAGEEALSGVLWVLKDLRYEAVLEGQTMPSQRMSITLTLEGGKSLPLVFTVEGGPAVWRGGKGYQLSSNTWESLLDAVARI